jgi:hypothetical protein
VCYCVGVNLFEKYKKLREREKKYKLSWKVTFHKE